MNGKAWKAFLNPGWIFTFILIITFTYVAFTVLAPWQLGKSEVVSHRNDLIAEHFDKEPAPFDSVFTAGGVLPPDNEYLRVAITGHYLPESEVIMRVRPVESGPAYHALTPFMMTDGTTVLVNRGWTRPENGHLPSDFPAPPTGEHTIIGYARIDEPKPQIAPTIEADRQMVTGIDTEEISELTGVTLAQDYVQLADGEPGVLTAFPLPRLDNGPHLSYGIQWIAFGILAPIGLGYFVFAELRERRREQEEQEALTGVVSEPAPSSAPAPSSTPAPRRSRYGNAKNQRTSWQRDDEERF
ncbi:SURF1 family protein [Corynebacterium hindlerae]|uniref:SURF1 family cytochrome oxidase biogenesis protein n=1 Tax=Corynebacterium hindlerae TaxID=699041 RepID=UPI001AD6C1E8|nr:SURF1 family protein [Corynebacterium hindlerae]QTH59160.1 SURF1 family protein [Corynebacterium hindlerae]